MESEGRRFAAPLSFRLVDMRGLRAMRIMRMLSAYDAVLLNILFAPVWASGWIVPRLARLTKPQFRQDVAATPQRPDELLWGQLKAPLLWACAPTILGAASAILHEYVNLQSGGGIGGSIRSLLWDGLSKGTASLAFLAVFAPSLAIIVALALSIVACRTDSSMNKWGTVFLAMLASFFGLAVWLLGAYFLNPGVRGERPDAYSLAVWAICPLACLAWEAWREWRLLVRVYFEIEPASPSAHR